MHPRKVRVYFLQFLFPNIKNGHRRNQNQVDRKTFEVIILINDERVGKVVHIKLKLEQ